MTQQILLVEDTISLAMVYRSVLEKAGYAVELADTLAQTRAAISQQSFDVILLDLLLPDGDGIEVLAEILDRNKDTRVVVITANGSINRAIDAMRKGAFDFLVKPFDEKRLTAAVQSALESVKHLTRETAAPARAQSEYHHFIGTSPQMQRIYAMIENIGHSFASVFITGESGTGKEVAAQAIHTVSGRAKGPFVALNCGAIPKDLLESEVFGHLKGSFTGAISDKKGAAESASGGTLFLDEICEMDLSLQTKLLRFLETQQIQPVGATRPKPVDVRILCATNRDPMAEVRAGRFREDLYYRLFVIPLHMPPLRDRPEDILAIVARKLPEYAAQEGKKFTGLSPEVTQVFSTYDWPGNVRQLLNVLRNIVVLHDGVQVELPMLPDDFSRKNVAPIPPVTGEQPVQSAPVAQPVYRPEVGKTLAQMEREYVESTVESCDGSVPEAAKILGVSPSTIYRKREAWKKQAV